MDEKLKNNENEAQIINHEDLARHNSRGIYMRDLLLKICEKLNIELSQLTSKTDINLENTLSEILDDKLFEDLDILGPEVKDLVGTNPKIGKAIVRLGDILKKKDHEMINKIETISGKIVDNRKNSFPGEVISDFLQENKNYFPKLEEFANEVFKKIQKNNRTRYIALCEQSNLSHVLHDTPIGISDDLSFIFTFSV